MPKDGEAGKDTPRDGAHSEAAAGCPDAMTLAAYLDNTMDAKEKARMEFHLALCAKCAKDVAELREILTHLGTEPEDASAIMEVTSRAKKIVDK